MPNVLTTAISIVSTMALTTDDVVAKPYIHEAIEEDVDWMHG